eukprot:GHUV01032719.1.p1 GENE.GHUV01032719.1~~GHUV01032719.1.p1  ORF type:complete len:187 (-),score=25.81 GHUV01032719.1:14-574(-)
MTAIAWFSVPPALLNLHRVDGFSLVGGRTMFGCRSMSAVPLLLSRYTEDADSVTVHFKKHEEPVQAGLLVASDGYFSRVRRQCVDDGPAEFARTLMWRARLPADVAAGTGIDMDGTSIFVQDVSVGHDWWVVVNICAALWLCCSVEAFCPCWVLKPRCSRLLHDVNAPAEVLLQRHTLHCSWSQAL